MSMNEDEQDGNPTTVYIISLLFSLMLTYDTEAIFTNSTPTVHYFIQEAPLTLRGQRSRCKNIKGETQIFGSFPSPRPRPLFLWMWFYGGSCEN